MFQFLIGTIKTANIVGFALFAEVQFQFLIGTIKTAQFFYYLIIDLKFQFLIGTIKTSMLKTSLIMMLPRFNSL